ncbi:MAG: hypothetical protein GTN80_03580 [Nitrososphaeria archaeon]|nr:hypothetical protein [Nitrososphaeria archaeon]NIN52257.1 hypothetical protein [Nitrososphaeria archaeon]NIQ32713.1 hypothetical protein [Nitrososphaeria archaeon]
MVWYNDKRGNLVFVSGHGGTDAETGETPERTGDQTKVALANIKRVLEVAGASMENIVKITVFLVDMEDFEEMNSVYKTFFKGAFPARSTFQVARFTGDQWKVETAVLG